MAPDRDALKALMQATKPEPSVEPGSEFDRALAQVEFRVAERELVATQGPRRRLQSWREAATREECMIASPDNEQRILLFNRALANHRQKETPMTPEETETNATLSHEVGNLKRALRDTKRALEIEKATRGMAHDEANRLARQFTDARETNERVRMERNKFETAHDAVISEKIRMEVDNNRLRRKNERLSQLLESTGTPMNDQNANDPDPYFDIEAARAAVAKTDAAGAAATPVESSGALATMLTDAVTLATVQQSSKLAVAKVSPLLVKAGVPEALVMDSRTQGILELALPFLISKYGSMVPGLKRMDTVRTLSQQQLVIGIAEIIGVSVMDLLKIGMDIVSSLNEGADATVDQLKDNLNSES